MRRTMEIDTDYLYDAWKGDARALWFVEEQNVKEAGDTRLVWAIGKGPDRTYWECFARFNGEIYQHRHNVTLLQEVTCKTHVTYEWEPKEYQA